MEMFINNWSIPGSFRDPSGYLFYRNNNIYRQVNITYKENYDHLMNSGLYEDLVNHQLLIPHEEVNINGLNDEITYRVISPEIIPFISYPYEWCFGQLKDAALTTLEIQRRALNYGMTLKDCSSYNIQFHRGKPVFIDTLSFEKYQEGKPWVAYRQFCQHFLAPLALMSYKDIRLNQLFRIYIDGIPLDLASSLLPLRTYLVFSLLSHIHLHARSQEHFANKTVKTTHKKINYNAFLGIIDSLNSAITRLTWKPPGTVWRDYYETSNYMTEAMQHKKELVAGFLDKLKPKNIWDLGSNTGLFSRIAAEKKIQTISMDIDPACVELNYSECKKNGESNLLPLLVDLANPSPGIGWQNEERMSLLKRGPVDTVLALALIHHLAISNNLPLHKIANFFSDICSSLIIEFIPKSDSQVKRLLSTRVDIFSDYKQLSFEYEFRHFFSILESAKIRDSERILYLMKKK